MVTELFEIADAYDPRIALGARGSLQTFNDAGILTSADIHVARRIALLAGDTDDAVVLAAALAVRAVRLGSVCVDLDAVGDVAADLAWPQPDAWTSAVQGSALVASGVLRWEYGLLYLDRYWQQEVVLCRDLLARADQPPPVVDEPVLEAGLQRVFGEPTFVEQRAASARAARQWLTVLTGGPGTGKTTTVAGLLTLLAEQSPDRLRIALTAPTGKAAARLQEAVDQSIAERLDPADRDRLGELQSSTLHRLLGVVRGNSTRFRHHRANRLSYDVIVVDESSMVSLTMMARLVEAVRPDARLILLGDPDQLASVEAGAVLSDLVAGFEAPSGGAVIRLRQTHRFGVEIGTLAEAVRLGDGDAVLEALRSGSDAIEFVETDDPPTALQPVLLAAAMRIRRFAEDGDAGGAIDSLNRHRLLCAHRVGPYGVAHWNRLVEHWLSVETGDPLYQPMYVGRPLLVTANDYGLGLYNGDSGVVVGSDDGLRAAISRVRDVASFAPSRLSEVETMHATTIHKSQGSQAGEVTVLLPPVDSRLLTRELFYTAVTRAVDKVRVVGSEAAVREAIERRVQRASGLRQRLRGS